MERSDKIQELYRVIAGLSNVEDCAARSRLSSAK